MILGFSLSYQLQLSNFFELRNVVSAEESHNEMPVL